jgi:hypothetical protein
VLLIDLADPPAETGERSAGEESEMQPSHASMKLEDRARGDTVGVTCAPRSVASSWRSHTATGQQEENLR